MIFFQIHHRKNNGMDIKIHLRHTKNWNQNNFCFIVFLLSALSLIHIQFFYFCFFSLSIS